MSNTNDDTNMTGNADNCDPLRTKSGQDERLKVAAHTEEQIQAFCRSHMLPRQNVVRIRKAEDLYGWRSKVLLLLPSWWLGTDSDAVYRAKDRGWKTAEVTEDEVLNGPTQPAPTPVEAQTGHGPTSMIELGLEPVPITKRPTPITDAEWQTECCSGASWYRIAERMKNRAADLERQLAEVTRQRDAAHQKCRDYRLVALGAEDALEKMTAQRDEAEKRAAIAESDVAKFKFANEVLHKDGERWRELSCMFAMQRDALVEALTVAMARAYAAGYQHGHDDSVEARFIIVDQAEAKEHFAEDVKQMLLDGSQPEAAAALAAVKETEG